MKIATILCASLVSSFAAAMISTAAPVITHGMRIDPQANGAGVNGYIGSSAATVGGTTVLVWAKVLRGDGGGNWVVSVQLAGLNGDGSLRNQSELAQVQFAGLVNPWLVCSVCPAGSGFLVTWRDLAGLHGQYLNQDGTPLGAGILLVADPTVIHYLHVAATGTSAGSAVLWMSSTGSLMCSLVASAGNPEVRTVEIAAAGPDYIASLALTANGPDLLAAWSLGNGKAYFRVIRPDATVPLSAVETGTLADGYSSLSATPSGDGFVLSFVETDPAVLYEGRIHRLLLLDKNGTLKSQFADPFIASSNLHACAFSPPQADGSVLAVRVNPQRGALEQVDSNLWTVRRIAADGTVGQPATSPASYFPIYGAFRILRTPAGLKAVSDSFTGRLSATILQALKENGTPDGRPQSAQHENREYTQQTPDVAWDGSRYLCVWQDGKNNLLTRDDIRLKAVGADGVPLGAAVTLAETPNHELSPAVAARGGVGLAVWTSREELGPDNDRTGIYGRLITEGQPSGPVFLIAASARRFDYTLRGVAIAAGPGGFFVSWISPQSPPETVSTDIFGTWVSREGAVSHPGGFAVHRGISGSNESIAVAVNDTQWLVAWVNDAGHDRKDIFGAFLPLQPPPAAPAPERFTICDAGDEQEKPRLLATPGGFRVLWKDARYANRINAIFTAALGNDGTISPPNGQEVAVAPPRVYEPLLLPRAGGAFTTLWLGDRGTTPPSIYPQFSLHGQRLKADGSKEESAFEPQPFADMEKDILEGATGVNGASLVFFQQLETGEDYSGSSWYSLKYALVFPDDDAVSLNITPQATDGGKAILAWTATRLFPADPALLETSTDLASWTPLADGVVNQSTATEGRLIISPSGTRFYRIRARLTP